MYRGFADLKYFGGGAHRITGIQDVFSQQHRTMGGLLFHTINSYFGYFNV